LIKSMITLPTLQQLRFLAALAEHRHFARAAASCNVTQSTLSAGLKELEKRLGASLVERHRRRALLTPLGAEVVVRGRKLLRDAEDLAQLVQSSREPLSGPLRLGVIPTIGAYVIPAAMEGLSASFPRLKLYLREEQSDLLLDKLDRGELDLLVLALPYQTGDVETMKLADDAIFAAVPKGHRLAQAKQIERHDLSCEPLLLLEDGHCLRSHALQACRLSEAGRNEEFQGTSLSTLLQMTAGSIGVTLVPQMALATEITPRLGLVVRRLSGDPSRTIALAWRRGSARKQEFRKFGRYLRNVLEKVRSSNEMANRAAFT
jgi:LysR family hydrogen peroxide-inducible transcriptional activator